MANVFCHFEPTGRHVDKDGTYYWKDDTSEKKHGPPYIIPGSPEEEIWHQEYPNGWHYQDPLWYNDEEYLDEEKEEDEEEYTLSASTIIEQDL